MPKLHPFVTIASEEAGTLIRAITDTHLRLVSGTYSVSVLIGSFESPWGEYTASDSYCEVLIRESREPVVIGCHSADSWNAAQFRSLCRALTLGGSDSPFVQTEIEDAMHKAWEDGKDDD